MKSEICKKSNNYYSKNYSFEHKMSLFSQKSRRKANYNPNIKLYYQAQKPVALDTPSIVPSFLHMHIHMFQQKNTTLIQS